MKQILNTKKNKNIMKNLKIKNLKESQKWITNKNFFQKTMIMTVVFASWIYVFNINITQEYITNIAEFGKGLLEREKLISNLDEIEDQKAIWPLREVVDWWEVQNYKEVRNTSWEEIPDNKKTVFPQKVSDVMEDYKYVSPYNIWETVSNPLEREKVTFYRRLITTSWTASYSCNQNECNWRKEWSWTHPGVDFVSAKWTPVYNATNSIVMEVRENQDHFGNTLITATNFEWEVVALFYAHLDWFVDWLSEWDILQRGDRIWYIGDSWNVAWAPHLHFQINRLWDEEEIESVDMARQLWETWQRHGEEWIESIREHTYNPIEFVENNLEYTTDAFEQVTYDDMEETYQGDVELDEEEEEYTDEQEEDTTRDSSEETDYDEEQILANIRDEIEDEYSDSRTLEEELEEETTKPLRISSVEPQEELEDIFVGDYIPVEIFTEWEEWVVTITASNNVIEPSVTTVDSSREKVYLHANNVWNSEVVFDDWVNKERLYFSVYQEDKDVYGLKINGPNTVYTSSEQKFTIYPIDSIWNRFDQSIKWDITIVLKNKSNWQEYTLEETQENVDISGYEFEVKVPELWDFAIEAKAESNNYYLETTTSVEADLFYDYSKEDGYGDSVAVLNSDWIVRWHEGKLMPNREILRSELVAILMRYKYWFWDNYRNEAKEYIEENWRFLNDISWEEWYAPYFYKAWKDWVIEWDNNRALASEATQKDEVLAMFGRFFDITRNEQYTTFLDVNENDWYKEYADAARIYNLYPFEDSDYLNHTKNPPRIKVFESLERYRNHSTQEFEHQREETTEEDVEEVLRGLMDE